MQFLSGFVSSWDKYDILWLTVIGVILLVSYKMRNNQSGQLADFLHDNAAKLLVLSVFYVLLIYAHHSSALTPEAKFAEWSMTKAGEALACFFGLITGSQIRGGNGKPPEIPNPPTPPPAPGAPNG